MAGIILKDGNGNEIDYGNIDQIIVPYKYDNGQQFDYRYTLLSSYNIYFIRENAQNKKWEVAGKVSKISTGEFFMTSVYEKDCKNFGRLFETKHDDVVIDSEYGVSLFFTLKELTVGEMYEMADMY